MKDTTLFEHKSHIHANKDIGIYYCGKRINTQNHVYGPKIRDHYLLVLVNSGRAVIHGKSELALKEHDLFVMLPGEKIHYTAATPWSIQWVGLYGHGTDELMTRLNVSPDNPIIRITQYRELEAVLDELYACADSPSATAELMQISLVYKLFSILFGCVNAKTEINYAEVAKKIIDYNFSNGLTVEKLADELYLNPAYFTRLFTRTFGISPKQYILEKQISKAQTLLSQTNATIGEIANSVGFCDQLYFSRAFKKATGFSPTEYKNRA